MPHARGMQEVREVIEIQSELSDNSELPFQFNEGRVFAISINSSIPEAHALRKNIGCYLTKEGVLDKFIFEWFHTRRLQSMKIMIGRRIPKHIAQKIMQICEQHIDAHIIFTFIDDDDDLGHTQRIYIGSVF